VYNLFAGLDSGGVGRLHSRSSLPSRSILLQTGINSHANRPCTFVALPLTGFVEEHYSLLEQKRNGNYLQCTRHSNVHPFPFGCAHVPQNLYRTPTKSDNVSLIVRSGGMYVSHKQDIRGLISSSDGFGPKARVWLASMWPSTVKSGQ
jgi:hypothetical protein